MSKLPKITFAFWLMKITATTLGETGGDFFSMTMNLGYGLSILLFMAVFATALTVQMRASAYHPALYWAVIVSTSTVGTAMSDYIDRTMGLGYAKGSALLIGLLLAVLIVWKLSTGSLDVSNVRGRKAECFYWTAILVSNTLGTALGDYLADSSGLGFAGGAALISGLLLLILAAHRFAKFSKVALFWAAFVLTRPLGATFGDLLTKTHAKGGLDLGTAGSSIVLTFILFGLVAWTGKSLADSGGGASALSH